MKNTSEKLYLYNDLTERILSIRDQLSSPPSDQLIDSLSLSLFDLVSIVEELKIAGLPEIGEDMRQVLSMILSGKRSYNDMVKESIQLLVGLMYRSAVNNEPCLQEIEDLAMLVQGIKRGDSDGFFITDHKIPLNDDAQVSLFDDGVSLFDDDDSAVLFDDGTEDQQERAPDSKPDDDSAVLFDDGTKDQQKRTSIPKPAATVKLNPLDFQPLRILIVDDDFNSRFLMRHVLADYGTYDFATNGVEAVQAFQLAHECGQPYDVVFLDISMPMMDGQQALQEMREFEREMGAAGKEAIIFMVTCLTAYETVCQAFFKGYCTDYIAKPVKFEQIINKMQEYDLLRPRDQACIG
ncbi:MAG: response regulator [Magnetococcus sp. YQC-5]